MQNVSEVFMCLLHRKLADFSWRIRQPIFSGKVSSLAIIIEVTCFTPYDGLVLLVLKEFPIKQTCLCFKYCNCVAASF